MPAQISESVDRVTGRLWMRLWLLRHPSCRLCPECRLTAEPRSEMRMQGGVCHDCYDWECR